MGRCFSFNLVLMYVLQQPLNCWRCLENFQFATLNANAGQTSLGRYTHMPYGCADTVFQEIYVWRISTVYISPQPKVRWLSWLQQRSTIANPAVLKTGLSNFIQMTDKWNSTSYSSLLVVTVATLYLTLWHEVRTISQLNLPLTWHKTLSEKAMFCVGEALVIVF
jgi:hypothetical protein